MCIFMNKHSSSVTDRFFSILKEYYVLKSHNVGSLKAL